MPRSRVGVWMLLLAALAVASAMAAWAAMPAQADDEPRDPQIVGGAAVPNGKYPFMVSLQDKTRISGPPRGHFCGGTLVAAQYVLTAAHCADSIRADVTLRNLRVVVGTTVLRSNQGQVRSVTGMTSHPNFNRRTYAYDAAVLRLDRPVTGVLPIRLSPAGSAGNALERPGLPATVAGWGNTIGQGPGYTEPDAFPNRMREARPPLVSDSRCGRAINADFGPGFFVGGVEVCAGKTGVDTCQGDSGGPMFVRTRTGRFVQIGVTSYGNGCAAPGNPGVYAEVNSRPIRNFIVNATGGAAR